VLHRIVDFQPAIVCSDGILEYWKDGFPHADVGPAIISIPDSSIEYWYSGVHIFTRSMSKEESKHYEQLFINERLFWEGYFFTELDD
jgi:hypothetical protein